jgi:predicted LPLAT superfamily acyltransferase
MRRSAHWITTRERGSITLLRGMAYCSLRFGRRVTRSLIYCIALYFFLFAPRARRHSRAYLRLALGREPGARDRFRQILSFATTIHDRFFLVDGRDDLFEVTVEGESLMRAAMAGGHGAFLMGAHLGSFEMLRSVGRRATGLRVAMVMYEDNARKLNAMLAAVNPAAVADIIPLGHVDAMLKVSERLDGGALVGMLGDRTLGDEPLEAVTLLGRPAHLPTGPLRLAAILRRPVIFMAGLYRGGNRYHVVFAPLADFSSTPARGRDAAVRAAVHRYAALLDRHCRGDPYNWFNFFDFWRAPGGPA